MEKEMDDNLDLLDLEEEAGIDTLPEVAPNFGPRPKKPWLLLGVMSVVLVVAIVVIVRVIGHDSGSSIEIDLDAPIVTVDGNVPTPAPTQVAPMPQPAQQPQPQPAVKPVQPAAPMYGTPGVPTRVVEDRQDVTFNPDAGNKPAAPVVTKPASKPAAKPAAKPVSKPASKPAAPAKPAAKKPKPATHGSWYVQFGSYSTRALAEGAEQKIRAAHPNLFTGHQFVILAAQLPNGNTTYRLRIAFATSNDANGFCRNAKSDGLDCYVAK